MEVAYDDIKGSEDSEDTAAVVNLMAGWSPNLEGDFGFRADYGMYADFHQDLDEYNVIEQVFSIEPYLNKGALIYSLPVRYTFGMEDQETDYHRIALYPTLTFKIPDRLQAIEAYGFVSHINDDDDYAVDEDAIGAGAGIGYIIFSQDRSYIRLSAEYQNTGYDAAVADYGISTNTDDRSDNALSANLELNYQLLSYMDLYSNYSYIHTNSNVSIYDYDRHIIEGGVSFSF
ncbi:MAG: hypothetical protein ACLFRF_02430 [Desulfobacterales bacterium]